MSWTEVIEDLKEEEIFETFYEKEFQKLTLKDFRGD